MKKTNGLLLTAMLFLTLIIGTSTLSAEGPKDNDKKPVKEGVKHDLFSKLGLSADQKASIETLKSEDEKANIQKKADIKISMVDLKAEMKKDAIDMAKITDLAGKISLLHADLEKAEIIQKAKFLSILTKEQRTKLEELKEAKNEKKEHQGKDKDKGEHEDNE